MVGGDKLPYASDSAAPAANLIESKILFNSVISTKCAKFMTIDIGNFFLSSHMQNPEYMKIHQDDIPQDILEQYQAVQFMDNKGYVYFKITKGMYGFKQAAILAYHQLKENMSKHDYYHIPHTMEMWKHKSRPTTFCLCVDDFGIKYESLKDAQHLIAALQEYYKITIDWSGKHYCGLTLDWDYEKQFVGISMPGYINSLLSRIHHQTPKRSVDTPHKWTASVYGQKQQLAPQVDSSPLLSSDAVGKLQSCNGLLLFYARAVDPSMLVALNEIVTKQAKPTEDTQHKLHQILDYVATHPNAVIRYHKSDMVLHVDSDVAYLVLPKTRSRLAGHYFLSTDPTLTCTILPNGPILTECQTIKHVVASSAEAEISALFHNAQSALPIWYLLQQMGHPQPPTPLKTDNMTANAFVHQEMRHKKSKAWNMRLWWLKDKVAQQNFKIFWDKGINNWADYFTKHFAPRHHQVMRQRYLQRTCAVIQQVLSRCLSLSAGEGVLVP